ncbi:unnamed protein product [Caenorhabditis nigoni]
MTENSEEKKFVIKHVFEDVTKLPNDKGLYGKEEKHFGIFWELNLYRRVFEDILCLYLECRKSEEVIGSEWSMEFEVDSDLYEDSKITNNKHSISEKCGKVIDLVEIYMGDLNKYLVNGNLEAEFHVTIKKMTGFELEKLKIFDDDVAKKFSDVCLLAGNQKFHVSKLFVASHSTYFESLFLGNFAESQKSIIELKDIDADDLQKFLEVLYGESAIDDDTVKGILKLADMFDAKTAIRRCEEFLLKKSKSSMKIKFTCAVRYKLDALKKKCLSELKTTAEVRELVPENADDFSPSVWKELFLKATSPQ